MVDDRLWQTETSHEGPVPPIFVNDNLLDLTVTAAAVGATATVAASPMTAAYGGQSNVMTVSGSDVQLAVVQSMGGFMQTNDGRWLVFDVSMSGGTYPDPLTGLAQATDDVGDVTGQFQQALSR